MFCVNCGNKIADGHKFCNQCGKPANGAVPEKSAKKLSRKIVNIVSWCLFVLLIVGTLTYFISSVKDAAMITVRHDEIKTLLAGMKDNIQTVGETMAATSGKEKKKDYQGMLQDVDTSLGKIVDLKTKATDAGTKLTALKTALEHSRDPAIKNTGLKFVDLAKNYSAAMVTTADDLKQFLDLGKAYTEALIAGKKYVQPAKGEIEKLQTKLQNDIASSAGTVKDYDSSEADFAKAIANSTKK